jgi:hypothetical protein
MKATALITGASSGIGLELAKIHASKGDNLVLVARNESSLNKLKEDILKSAKVDITIICKDLSKLDAAKELYQEIKSQNLSVNYLINNAGFGDYGFFHESDWSKTNEMIQLNITALTQLCHLFLPDLIASKNARIMNVASIAAFIPGPLMAVYYATKAFVLHFSEAIANELKGTGVIVTALCPGPTESGFQLAANLEGSKMIQGKKFPSSKQVAEYGYKSMMNGKTVAIEGTMNCLMAISARFTPRNMVAKIVRNKQDKRN